jgi:hypothetical protein
VSKVRQFGWLQRVDVIVLTVNVIALTAQGVNVLTLAGTDRPFVQSMALAAFALQWSAFAYFLGSVIEHRRVDRLTWRIRRLTGRGDLEPPVTIHGEITNLPGPTTLLHFAGEVKAALLVLYHEQWALCLYGLPQVVDGMHMAVIHQAWLADRQAAVVTAQLLCQPARVLWLESAEAVW